MSGASSKVFASILLILALAAQCAGWGADGHRIAGVIAERFLTPKTKAAIRDLLGDETLAKAGTWADEIRSDRNYDWAKPLHYVNVPRSTESVDPQRDCGQDKCVVAAIERFAKVLKDQNAPRQDRVEALKFLVHFVEDVHQPLHVSYEDDKGGNSVKVTYGGKQSNLHKVWDIDLIDQWIGREDWIALAASVSQGVTDESADKWRKTSEPVEWANESLAITKRLYADLPADGQLDKSYYDRNIGIVEERLSAAGVRLAVLLNGIFDPANEPGEKTSDRPTGAPAAPSAAPTAPDAPATAPAADSEAAVFISIVAGQECGNARGRQMFVVNGHETKTIRIVIMRSWQDRGKPGSANSTVVVKPGETGKRSLGCNETKLRDGEVRKFEWTIVTAEYADDD